MKRTNKKHFENLLPEVQEKFTTNILRQQPYVGFFEETFEDEDERTLIEFIAGSFDWNQTHEGWDFWAAIANANL